MMQATKEEVKRKIVNIVSGIEYNSERVGFYSDSDFEAADRYAIKSETKRKELLTYLSELGVI